MKRKQQRKLRRNRHKAGSKTEDCPEAKGRSASRKKVNCVKGFERLIKM